MVGIVDCPTVWNDRNIPLYSTILDRLSLLLLLLLQQGLHPH